MHLIDYVNLIMLLCLMKQVRLDLSGHMGRNEKIIKCLSVCLYFLPIGDCIVPFHFSFKVVFFLDLIAMVDTKRPLSLIVPACLFFMFIGDWNKHAKCSNWGESWWLCIYFWIIA